MKTPAIAIAIAACSGVPEPMTIAGVIYDPEAFVLGKAADVNNAQVFLAEDSTLGAQTDSNGAFSIQDVPANFNWHPIATNDPDYLRTLDGLGTPVTESDLTNYYVPLLKRGDLLTALAEYFAIPEAELETQGLVVAAIMSDRPPKGALLHDDLSVAVGGDPCVIENWAFVTLADVTFGAISHPQGVPPANWTGLVVLTGPLGCIVTVAIRDTTGQLDFLPHDMAIDNRTVMFQTYIAQ